MFSFVAGMTASEYVRNRRLTLAALELQTTDISVLDAAYKYGYETPESFSKAFSRFHGSTPKQARQKGAKLRLFNPLAIKIILEGGSIMDYRIDPYSRSPAVSTVSTFCFILLAISIIDGRTGKVLSPLARICQFISHPHNHQNLYKAAYKMFWKELSKMRNTM